MESITLWARNGEAVRQAIELGEIAHIAKGNRGRSGMALPGREKGVRHEWHLNLSKSFMRKAFCMLREAVA